MVSSGTVSTRKVRVCVVGDSGVGKTTLARWVARGGRTDEEEDEEEEASGWVNRRRGRAGVEWR